jgi:activator of HSP90 ATPase
LTWRTGKNAEGTEASGTINVPEVAYDTAEDEYVVCTSGLSPKIAM